MHGISDWVEIRHRIWVRVRARHRFGLGSGQDIRFELELGQDIGFCKKSLFKREFQKSPKK